MNLSRPTCLPDHPPPLLLLCRYHCRASGGLYVTNSWVPSQLKKAGMPRRLSQVRPLQGCSSGPAHGGSSGSRGAGGAAFKEQPSQAHARPCASCVSP